MHTDEKEKQEQLASLKAQMYSIQLYCSTYITQQQYAKLDENITDHFLALTFPSGLLSENRCHLFLT